jgi:hypothetical protein
MRRVLHVVYRDGAWVVLHQGYPVTGPCETKTAALEWAVAAGRKIRQNGGLASVIIHSQSGRIQSERTYGDDPRRFPG